MRTSRLAEPTSMTTFDTVIGTLANGCWICCKSEAQRDTSWPAGLRA